ncbi:MAG: SCO family protein [Phycisphaeraceae bacterium]|nr:SCO family protein [Phycisphaeraceae bacterium]
MTQTPRPDSPRSTPHPATSPPTAQSPARRVPIWIFIGLVASASLLITLLITIMVINRPRDNGSTGVGSASTDKKDTYLHGGTLSEPGADDPPVLGVVPAFRLVERAGGVYASTELAGKVWVADFIFTRCAGTCPRMTQELSNLQTQLSTLPRWKEIRLVSFTVDPTNDTPDVLRDYADSYKADRRQWIFLTGSRQDLWKLTKEGFKLPVGEDTENLQMPITHSSRFALVDQQGRIRGYYDAFDANVLDQLKKDIDKVLAEVPPVAETQPSTQPATQPK